MRKAKQIDLKGPRPVSKLRPDDSAAAGREKMDDINTKDRRRQARPQQNGRSRNDDYDGDDGLDGE